MPSPFLIRAAISDEHLQSLINAFPDVDFLVSSEGEEPHDSHRAVGMLTWGIDPESLSQYPDLRWIQWIGAGVERAPLQEIERRNIQLTNSSGVHGPNIAEHILAMMLAFTRQLPNLIRAQSNEVWLDDEARAGVSELGGSTLLIVGAGAIGSSLAVRAEALGMNVISVGRTPKTGPVDHHSVEELDELLAIADHVALCLPETADTKGLFDAHRLSRMKPGSFIYNIGRGSSLVTDDLVVALESGALGGAGLDVTDPEPLPSGHPLWSMDNVVITAHTAGATPKYWDRLIALVAENIDRFHAQRPLRNLIDLSAGY